MLAASGLATSPEALRRDGTGAQDPHPVPGPDTADIPAAGPIPDNPFQVERQRIVVEPLAILDVVHVQQTFRRIGQQLLPRSLALLDGLVAQVSPTAHNEIEDAERVGARVPAASLHAVARSARTDFVCPSSYR